ncbi:MAG: DUF5615 family PIN-like protein [Planctomycetaceae bacterium]
MTFLFDNNISYRYARMLSALGKDTVALRDRLPSNTTDVDVFAYLKGSDTVFVTVERRMRGRPVEVAAIKASGVTSLFIGPFYAKLGFWPAAEWFIRRWPTIEGFALGAKKGMCALVQQNGKSRVFQL